MPSGLTGSLVPTLQLPIVFDQFIHLPIGSDNFSVLFIRFVPPELIGR
jgi:hypothetical protein